MSSRQNLNISPINQTADRLQSHKSGNPVIQFIVGSQDRVLLGNSVRFAGQLQLFTDASETVPAGGTLRMDEALGAYSIIDQIVIKSQSGQIIEQIRHYGRMMASYLPVTSSLNDGLGHLNETTLTTPSYQAHKEGVVDIPSMRNTGNAFCIPLVSGLFNGQNPIPLKSGLIVEIHLAPDSNVLFSSDGTTAISEARYRVKNAELIAEVVTPEQPIPPTSTFEYNSISTFFTTFNSANAIVNFNLGLSRVLGVFGNIITASKINNTLENGLSCNFPVNSGTDEAKANINQLFFTRGGERFPLEYNIDTLQRENANDVNADPQIIRNYLNAVKQFAKLERTSINPLNTRYTSGKPTDVNVKVDGGSVAGVGVAYDVISGQGVNFSGVNFGLNMETGLVTDNPQALYLFVHSKQTLVIDGMNVQVMK